MKSWKSIGSTLPTNNIKLWMTQCPRTKAEKAEMMKIHYALAVEILICKWWYVPGRTLDTQSESSANTWETSKKSIGQYWNGNFSTWEAPWACVSDSVQIIRVRGFYWLRYFSWCRYQSVHVQVRDDLCTRAILWQSRLHKVVALSTTEAKYMATIEAGKELLWMEEFVKELWIQQGEFPLYCGNQSAIHLVKNVADHSRTKHIQRRYHWL